MVQGTVQIDLVRSGGQGVIPWYWYVGTFNILIKDYQDFLSLLRVMHVYLTEAPVPDTKVVYGVFIGSISRVYINNRLSQVELLAAKRFNGGSRPYMGISPTQKWASQELL